MISNGESEIGERTGSSSTFAIWLNPDILNKRRAAGILNPQCFPRRINFAVEEMTGFG